MSDPRAIYVARREERTRQLADLERRHRWLSPARLGSFVLTLVVAWFVTVRSAIPTWVVLVPAGGFLGLVLLHIRARTALARARRGVEFLSRGLSRLDGSWIGNGQPGSTWQEPNHPFAADLDLFGGGSLFELLCEACTLAGRRTLSG